MSKAPIQVSTEMRPSSIDSLKEYFEHQIAKIQSGYADMSMLYTGQEKSELHIRPEITDATYSCVYFFVNAVSTDEVVDICDEDGLSEIPWHEYQKSVVDLWQTVEDLKESISTRLEYCGLEEYEEMWSIGDGDQFDYSSDEAFLAEVQWDYLLGITKSCWNLVSINS